MSGIICAIIIGVILAPIAARNKKRPGCARPSESLSTLNEVALSPTRNTVTLRDDNDI